MLQYYLATAFVILQVLDLLTTAYFMSHSELGLKEGNPVLAKLFSVFGVIPTLIVAKTALCVVLIVYMHQLPEWFLAASCIFYVYVVTNNLKLIVK